MDLCIFFNHTWVFPTFDLCQRNLRLPQRVSLGGVCETPLSTGVMERQKKNLYLVKRKISMQVSPPVNPPACSSAHHYKPSCVRVQGLHATDFFHREETKYTTDARKKTASFVSVMHLKQLQYHQPHVVSGKKTKHPKHNCICFMWEHI